MDVPQVKVSFVWKLVRLNVRIIRQLLVFNGVCGRTPECWSHESIRVAKVETVVASGKLVIFGRK